MEPRGQSHGSRKGMISGEAAKFKRAASLPNLHGSEVTVALGDCGIALG